MLHGHPSESRLKVVDGRNQKAASYGSLSKLINLARREYALTHDNVFTLNNPAGEEFGTGLD
jgi:hypothetical protein